MDGKTDHPADEPRSLRVFDLAQSHAKEIRALTQAVKNVQKNRNAAQSVPHYMRRRAASHNANRLPRNVRKVFEKFVPDKVKRPSRYYRRRPKNLMDEYAKRQRRVHWLETHIWHAKRFHMTEAWGYKLPNYPTGKGERSAHRAATQRCLVQDQSYINCIDVRTKGCRLLPVLKTLTSPLEYDGDMERYARGVEVLQCTLYHAGQYPAGAICPIQVIFNPVSEDGWSQAWLWCHTLAFGSVWNVLCKAFCVEDGVGQEVAQNEQVVLTNLREKLVRFKLSGKRTFETLTRVIHPTDTDVSAEGDHVWWKGEFANSSGEITSNLKAALKEWYRCNGTVATVRARDPRLCMPSIISLMKREKVKKEQGKFKDEEVQWGADQSVYNMTGADEDKMDEGTISGELGESLNSASLWSEKITKIKAAQSALWSARVRENVSSHMMSQHEINQRRSELLVPGSEMSLGSDESCIPLMLILSSNKADVILPSHWAMAFWIAFVYSGASPGGLRDDRVISACVNELHFPTDFPDTEIYQKEDLNAAKELTQKHFKYPPNKRPNFDKLSTNSPFGFDWSGILAGRDPVVLRDRHILDSLLMNSSLSSVPSVPSCLANLVRVAVRMVRRGTLQLRAEICIPSAEDIDIITEDSASLGPTVELNNKKATRRKDTHATLPADRIKTSREVIGFVTAGVYSLQEGMVRGHGFVTLQSLLGLTRIGYSQVNAGGRQLLVCLIRAADSRQYRFAYLRVIGGQDDEVKI